MLYQQFNDINFYVEDYNQEHFYFNIFKRLFPNLKFEKIFPLNGKYNVIDAARSSVGNHKKVYIVDLDFDGILGVMECLDNLFYLDKYCIENYLPTKYALFELIREKDSKLKNDEIENLFDYNSLLSDSKRTLTELACVFLLIQKYSLGITHFGVNFHRDFDFRYTTPVHKSNEIRLFIDEVEIALRQKNHRFRLKPNQKNYGTF